MFKDPGTEVPRASTPVYDPSTPSSTGAEGWPADSGATQPGRGVH